MRATASPSVQQSMRQSMIPSAPQTTSTRDVIFITKNQILTMMFLNFIKIKTRVINSWTIFHVIWFFKSSIPFEMGWLVGGPDD